MNDDFAEVPARIRVTTTILQQMLARLSAFQETIVPQLGRTNDSVLIPVQMIENGYTAVETLFMRISQAFENNLEDKRWNSHLLEKMTLEIPGARPRVISDASYRRLLELMRFRHFKRYYFELDYDWRKVDLLIEIFTELVPLLTADLAAFEARIRQALEG